MAKTIIKQLSNALGAHGDLGLTRDAMVLFLRRNTDPRESVERVRVWLESEAPALPHDRWFQRVAVAFLAQLNPTARLGLVVDQLAAAALSPSPAERLEKRVARFLVPGIRHRLMAKARRERMKERLVGARY